MPSWTQGDHVRKEVPNTAHERGDVRGGAAAILYEVAEGRSHWRQVKGCIMELFHYKEDQSIVSHLEMDHTVSRGCVITFEKQHQQKKKNFSPKPRPLVVSPSKH